MNLSQRLESIEKEVAELKKIINPQDKLTRSDVVKMAKSYLKEMIDRESDLFITYVSFGKYELGHRKRVEFVVNSKKRTVVVLLKNSETGTVHSKGIAKCLPQDVFNIHIGKAIALHKALHQGVPEVYLNAPQPNRAELFAVVEANPIEALKFKLSYSDEYKRYQVGFSALKTFRQLGYYPKLTVIDDSKVY